MKLGLNNYYMEITENWPRGTFNWSVTVENGDTKESKVSETLCAEDR